MERLELQGANCIFSVASYNRCLDRQKLPNLKPITVMRTALVGGGMFLLRKEGKPPKMLVNIDDHACAYQRGILMELQRQSDHGIGRIEFMNTKDSAVQKEVFQAGFDKLQRSLCRSRHFTCISCCAHIVSACQAHIGIGK